MYIPTPYKKKQPRAGCLKQGAATAIVSSEPILKVDHLIATAVSRKHLGITHLLVGVSHLPMPVRL